MSEDRKHEFELEIGAAPDEVWRAVSEAEGIERWFAPEARVTPGPGGSVTLSWGPGIEGTAPIHLWEDGKRFGWTEGEAKRVEFEIEPAAGGERTRLRLVQSGFGAEARFDDEFESTHGGWQIFLAMLRHAAEQWAKVRVTRHVHHSHFAALSTGEAWRRLARAAGLPDGGAGLNEGVACSGAIAGRAFTGRVARFPRPGYLLVAAPEAMIALFSEKGGPGKALVTVQWVMAGGEDAGAAARYKGVLAEWTKRVCDA